MTDSKITQLIETTSPLTTDILPIVTDPAGTPATKKVTIASIVTAVKASAAEVTTGTSDVKLVTPKAIKDAGLTIDTDGTFASNSDLKVPSQKASKTYADTKIPSSYLDIDGTLASNLDTKIASQKATKTYADTKIASSYLDTDVTLAANSDSKLATQKATKTYADTKIPSSYLDTDVTLAANSDTKIATQKATKAYVTTSISAISAPAQNFIINSDCKIGQRSTSPNISTSFQYGLVDRFAAKATGTAVSAGTITQTTSANVGASGYALKLAGVTVTGTGILYLRYRMESADAKNFKNLAGSFACKVYHDVGSAINYTVYVRKPTAADNFATTTDIANSGAVSVPSATATTLSFLNINTGNLGDCSNGLEIEIQVACGAVTTKNFEFTEFVFGLGATAPTFVAKTFDDELRKCQRYYEKSYSYTTAPGTATNVDAYTSAGLAGNCTIGDYLWVTVPYMIPKRAVVAPAFYDMAGTPSKCSLVATNTAVTDGITLNIITGQNGFSGYAASTATTQRGLQVHFAVDSEL